MNLARKTRHIIGRRSLLVGASGLLASPSLVRAQTQSNGVALVIGNSKYHWEAQLPNVKRDAPDVAKTFQSFGLKTELVMDAGRDAMNRAFEKFGAASHGANLAAFYFAGHGASWGRKSYLVPVDADLSSPSTVETLVNTLATGNAMSGAANRLIVFDNCRNNPADGWRQLEAERNAVLAYNSEQQRSGVAGRPNTLVLFSTAPGHIALDGPAGQNSPFAAAFMRRLQGDTVDLQSIPSKLRRDLLIATEGRQVMWDRNNFQQPFVVNAPGNRKTAGSPSGAGDSGRAGDPSRIIELPKAYAYARENDLPLPSGLIAYRPRGNSQAGQMVGSFQFLTKNSLGPSPQLLVVLSVEGQPSAEVITSGRGRFNPKTNKVESGSVWRFVTGRISGGKLEFVPRDGAAHMFFDWRDANSGSYTEMNDQQVGGKGFGASARFTRLDG